MPRRASLVFLVLGAGLVLLALRSAVAYDFERYVVVSGFEASRWTWVLVVGGGALALLGLCVRRDLVRRAAIANAIASACVAITIIWTVGTTPPRVQPARDVIDCGNQNIGAGCRLHGALDALESGTNAVPSRALLIVTLGMYALMSASLMRRRASSRSRGP
jgi:hypothetical protein